MTSSRALFIISLGVLLISCHHQPKLRISFNQGDNLDIGSKVYSKGHEIGEINYIGSLDDHFVADIDLEENVRVPVGSTFIIEPNLQGEPAVVIIFSDEHRYLGAGDISKTYLHDKNILDKFNDDTLKKSRIEKALKKMSEKMPELTEAGKDSTDEDK